MGRDSTGVWIDMKTFKLASKNILYAKTELFSSILNEY